jgi:triacylglycerol lipase
MELTPADLPFDARTSAYSLNNAYWLARAANIAYQEKSTIELELAGLGLENFRFLSNDDTEGFVAGNDEIIVVSFRGTEPTHLQDLFTDAQLHKVAGPLGDIHRGFLHGFDIVSEDTYATIQAFRNQDKPQSLWFTGHSLGAALAAVAVSHLLAKDQNVSGLYTFGQPRVGSVEFARAFNEKFKSRHFRFVNNNDAVTRVPPRELNYSHTGELRYIDSDGVIQDDIGMWQKFLDRISGRMEDFLEPGSDGLKDHSMDLYEGYLATAVTAD